MVGSSCQQRVQLGDTDGTCSVSKETAAFLDDILKDKKLSIRAKQEFNHSIRAGTSRWVDCANTGAATCQQTTSNPQSKFAKPNRNLQQPQQPLSFRPSIKTQQQIAVEQAQQPVERYHVKPGVDRQAEKERLVNIFAYGKKQAEKMQLLAKSTSPSSHLVTTAGLRMSSNQPLTEQLIDQIIEEVNERMTFIKELQQQGMLTREHEAIVKAEVSQRLAELRRLGVQPTT